MKVDRRRFTMLGGLSVAAGLWPGALPAPAASAQGSPAGAALADPAPFSPETVDAQARRLAQAPYQPPEPVPAALRGLDYDAYRAIRFRPERAIWRDSAPVSVQLFHPGFLFDQPVALHLVEDGEARPLPYDPGFFRFDAGVPEEARAAARESHPGYAGFRLHSPLNRPDIRDEFCVFQGASYFRAVARGQAYGLSGRGLSLGTGEADEEFPTFRALWIERPAAGRGAPRVTVHALLDSPSVAGAYHFTITPGDPTRMSVAARLFPRQRLDRIGIAPLTSMYFFGPADPLEPHAGDDFRPAVHDSAGLAIHNGRGEWLWRPLGNPPGVRFSGFQDDGPRRFALVQRPRRLDAYQDLEAAYHRRPSLTVVPAGDWGPGEVVLVELPTDKETHDNIAAFWRPDSPPAAGEPVSLTYDLLWGDDVDHTLARVVATRTGIGGNPATPDPARRLYVVDFAGGALSAIEAAEALSLSVSASAGTLSDPVAVRHPGLRAPRGGPGQEVPLDEPSGGWRISFQHRIDGLQAADLRLDVRHDGVQVAESWVYRWTA